MWVTTELAPSEKNIRDCYFQDSTLTTTQLPSFPHADIANDGNKDDNDDDEYDDDDDEDDNDDDDKAILR